MHPALAWPRKHWRWLAGAGVLLILYAAAGFWLVPRLAHDATQEFAARLGKQITVERIEFNPFTLAARVYRLQISETAGQPVVGFDELFVNLELSTLWHRALTFAQIRLVAPAIDAVIDAGGRLNLATLVPPSGQTQAAEPAALPAIRIGLFEVANGRVTLEDRTRSTPFRAAVAPIEFTLNDFRTAVDYQNAYHFAGTTEAGEQLEWSGQFSVQPLGSTGSFSIAGLRAATLWAYVRDQVSFTLPSGTIDLGGTYRLAVDDGNEIELGIGLPQVRFTDFAVAPLQPAEGPAWVTVPELVLVNTTFSLAERRLAVQQVAIDGARVDVWRETDGTVNLTRLAGTGQDAAPSPAESATGPAAATGTPTEPARGWQAEIASFEIRNATVHASDRSIEPAVEIALSPITVTLTELSSDTARPFNVAADLRINESGRLQATGTVRPDNLLADLDVELTDFGVPVLQPYISRATAMTVGSGRFGINGHATYAAQPEASQPQLAFKGEIELVDFASKDRLLEEDFLNVGRLNVMGIDYSFGPDRLTIERIHAREPYARVIISPDAKLNVTQVLSPDAADDTAANDSDAQTTARSRGSTPSAATSRSDTADVMPIRIGTVVIENGSANFADYSIEPSFATGIQSLAGTVQGLSSAADTRAKVDLKGSVDRFSPVVIAGEVNLLSAALYTDLRMSFSNMELTTFNPYSGKFAGYNIAKGKLTTELTYKVENRALAAEHHIILDQLEFGAATGSKDAVPLPVKLAVALLKDRNGVIDIDLPVRGSLDDPTFRLGPIIWQAIVGLLTKIVTAPFALLGSLFGGGEDLAFIDFAPGSAELLPESAQKLGTLTRALAERPQLNLDIPLTVRTAADAEALAKATLVQNVPVVADAVTDDPAVLQQRLQALTQAHTKFLGTAPLQPQPAAAAPDTAAVQAQIGALEQALLTHFAPDDTQLEMLARNRAEAVQGALLGSGEIAPERIFLTTRELPGQNEETVRMELKLE